MTFSELSNNRQALQCTYNILLFFFIFFVLAEVYHYKRRVVLMICMTASLLACYIMLQLTSACVEANNGYTRTGSAYKIENSIPNIIWIVILVVLNIITIAVFFNIRYFKRNKLTPLAIKEAVDNLPSGMCYYYDGGRVLMANRVMNVISHRLSGHTVLNGEELWKSMRGDILKSGDSVYSLEHKKLQIGGIYINEIIASDITEEYALSESLKQNNERLKTQKEHLMEIGQIITDMTIQKEMLNAKIILHDELGNALIATKTYLSGKSEQRGYTVSMAKKHETSEE